MKKCVWRVLTIVLAIVGCVTVLLLVGSSPNGEAGRKGNAIALKAPPFISVASADAGQRSGTSFLETEAGIAAYANAGQPITLSRVRPLFRTIERETSEYLIGSVRLAAYPETEDPHAYVHRDGWVVAYYLNDEPTSKIIGWQEYDAEGLASTKLEDVITLIFSEIGAVPASISYYDFEYPNATYLMIVADAESDGDRWDSFQLQIPGSFIVYERSWSHSSYDATSQFKLDGAMISQFNHCGNCWRAFYGELQRSQLAPSILHTIELFNDESCGDWGICGQSYCAIALVYREGP